MSEPFHGVLPALITPFTDDGDALDTGALATIVDRLIAGGAGGRRRRDDRPAVLRPAVVAGAARPLHGRRRRDRRPDHVLQPARRLRRDADRRAVAAAPRR